MSLPMIHYCPGNLTPVKNATYSLAFRKEMFEGARVPHVLTFNSPGKYLSDPDDIALTVQLSISGVQVKFSLIREGKNLLKTDRKGEYILKPVPAGVGRAEEAPANEHLTMQLARQVYGIQTAVNGLIFYADQEPAYLTRRFDRKPDGTKYRQEDFAQLSERTEDTHGKNYKYDFSYEEAASLMKKYTPAYAAEIEKFFQLILFNYLVSNGDAHLKNFSLIESVDRDYVLAPAYDLLSSRLHSPNERDLAPTAGLFSDYSTASFQANGFYGYDDFHEFGIRIGIVPIRVKRILDLFRSEHQKAKVLIDRSYLTEVVKTEYFNNYRDRLTRLNYSFAGMASANQG